LHSARFQGLLLSPAITGFKEVSMPKNSDKGEFKAWLDKMPGANNTLHVTGKVTVPTTGFHVSLVEAVPQGINPKILILEVKKVRPTGAAGDVVTHVPVRYDRAHSPDYTDVTIRDDGNDFTIPVEVVH
jgi:hypothetical protein